MSRSVKSLTILIVSAVLSLPLFGGDANAGKVRETSVVNERGVLWREPVDIGSRNLYYGSGGEKHQPHGPFTFLEEDMNGTNPKYVVRDQDNVKWTIKLGIEARPETVATRLVWAAGYFTNEDYYLDDLQVAEMPAHVKRGGNLIGPGGTMHAARLKRHEEKDLANWQWRNNPFTGTRELNGLKVLMALMNNWDLKDVNNKVYAAKKDSDQQEYVISDLGASFGTNGITVPLSRSKGDLNSYAHSQFLGKISPEFVDFRTPVHPSLFYAYWLPGYLKRARLDNVLHHIPRDDARWMGHLLSGLSASQIQDAFRAAGYTQAQIDAFSKIVEERISALNNL
jgi:hypothetical protein